MNNMVWNGTLYTAADPLEASGNSGFLDLHAITGRLNIGAIIGGSFHLVPADLAGNETLDLVINSGVNPAGLGDAPALVFTQVTSSNASEIKSLTAGASIANPKLVWTLAGTTISLTFAVHASLILAPIGY